MIKMTKQMKTHSTYTIRYCKSAYLPVYDACTQKTCTYQTNDQSFECHHPLSTAIGTLEEGQDKENIDGGDQHYTNGHRVSV